MHDSTLLHDNKMASMGTAAMQVWASGGSSLTASTCSPSLGVRLQVACKKSWPQQLQCWTLVPRSLCLKIFSTHLNDAPIRERLALQSISSGLSTMDALQVCPAYSLAQHVSHTFRYCLPHA